MWAGSEGLFISADLRDLGLEDLRIRAQGMSLIFDGTLRPELPNAEGGTHRAKKAPAAFSHVLELPYEVNGDDIDVQNENGLVSIVLKRRDSGRQNSRAAQSSFRASIRRFFGENESTPRSLKDEIAMLETIERYLAFQSVKGTAR
ncbi:MAG: Hsp20 family protein [Syntrophaceae bacterium]|nr:Hsp20 family protein [Syntrophaceae bacterium]